MQFRPLPMAGAFAVEIEPREDERGFFARSFCRQEFAEHGMSPVIAQCNVSWNRLRGTLRGIHFQRDPHWEAKLVRCTQGAAYDVVVDLRTDSPTYLKWAAVEITAANRTAVYAPSGFGHGFQTLCDDTEIFYQMSEPYYPELSGGIRWNDTAIAVEWPILPPIVSDRDNSYQDFQP